MKCCWLLKVCRAFLSTNTVTTCTLGTYIVGTLWVHRHCNKITQCDAHYQVTCLGTKNPVMTLCTGYQRVALIGSSRQSMSHQVEPTSLHSTYQHHSKPYMVSLPGFLSQFTLLNLARKAVVWQKAHKVYCMRSLSHSCNV